MIDDWSDNLDDRGPGYWEAYFDGPDPEELEVPELRREDDLWEEESRRASHASTDLFADRKEFDLYDYDGSDRRSSPILAGNSGGGRTLGRSF